MAHYNWYQHPNLFMNPSTPDTSANNSSLASTSSINSTTFDTSYWPYSPQQTTPNQFFYYPNSYYQRCYNYAQSTPTFSPPPPIDRYVQPKDFSVTDSPKTSRNIIDELGKPFILSSISLNINKFKIDEDQETEKMTTSSKRRIRTQFTNDQKRYLLLLFRQSTYPSREMLEEAARNLGVTVPIIQTWFKNTRSKQKKLTNTKNL